MFGVFVMDYQSWQYLLKIYTFIVEKSCGFPFLFYNGLTGVLPCLKTNMWTSFGFLFWSSDRPFILEFYNLLHWETRRQLFIFPNCAVFLSNGDLPVNCSSCLKLLLQLKSVIHVLICHFWSSFWNMDLTKHSRVTLGFPSELIWWLDLRMHYQSKG